MDLIYAVGLLILSLAINFLPTIIAMAKGNSNKFNVLLLNGIPYAISVLLIFIPIPFINIPIAILTIILWIVALVKAILG